MAKWYRQTGRVSGVLLGACSLSWFPPAGRGDDRTSAAASPETPQERDLLSAAGEGFALLRSEHFVLAYDTPAPLARSAMERLEATYADGERFCERLMFPLHRPPYRLEAILFARPESFRAYAERLSYDHRGSLGFYHAASNRSAFLDSASDPDLAPARRRLADLEAELEAYREALRRAGTSEETVEVRTGGGEHLAVPRKEAVARLIRLRAQAGQFARDLRQYMRQSQQMLIQHEAAHQVLFNHGVHRREGGNPRWLMEGLACLFEPPPVSGPAGLSGVNQFRLYDLRRLLKLSADARSISAEQIRSAVADGAFVYLAQLISDPSVFDRRDPGVWPAYAEAWALAHYLYTERPADLAQYLRRVLERRTGEQSDPPDELGDVVAVFGPVDENLCLKMLEPVLRLPAPTARAELK